MGWDNVDWIQHAQGRFQLGAFMEAVVVLWVP
jgi:hypothetical protein